MYQTSTVCLCSTALYKFASYIHWVFTFYISVDILGYVIVLWTWCFITIFFCFQFYCFVINKIKTITTIAATAVVVVVVVAKNPKNTVSNITSKQCFSSYLCCRAKSLTDSMRVLKYGLHVCLFFCKMWTKVEKN